MCRMNVHLVRRPCRLLVFVVNGIICFLWGRSIAWLTAWPAGNRYWVPQNRLDGMYFLLREGPVLLHGGQTIEAEP